MIENIGPTIHNGESIYNTGAGGGGGGGGETVEIDSKTYPVVTMGSQKWIAYNLDYVPAGVTIGGSGSDIITAHAWYYNNDEARYGWNNKKYGLLYNMAAMEIVSSSLTDGWRVPTKADFESLISFLGGTGEGKKIRSPYDWNNDLGEGLFNLNILPCGIRDNSGSFGYLGTQAVFCTTTHNGANFTYQLNLAGYTLSTYNSYKGNSFSIRLVKDA